MWHRLYRDRYLLDIFRDIVSQGEGFRFPKDTFALCLTMVTVAFLLPPSFAKAEKVYSSDPTMTAQFIWPPEGSYCLLPPAPAGIPCILKIVDYDAFSVPNRKNLSITNLEQTDTGLLQAFWRVEPSEAGGFRERNYNGSRITFLPNPNYNNGRGGPVTLIVTIYDTDPNEARKDAPVTIKRTITLVPKPSIHAIQIEVVRASDPDAVVGYEIPFTSGQVEAKKVKWRLIGIRPLPTPFKVVAESWSVTGIGNFNGNPVLTDIISNDQEHSYVTVTFTFTWENPITGEQGTDTKSISVPVCFYRQTDFDEWEGSPRGYTDKFGNYNEPPNWFDDRPNHWPSAITGLKESYVYYRSHDPEDNPWWGLIHYGRFDWNGAFDPTGQNRVEYRGRIYIYSAAVAYDGGHGYRPKVMGIDLCGIIVAHEMRHKEVFEAAWDVTYPNYTDEKLKFPDGRWKPFSGEDDIDYDGDGISDWFEKANQNDGWNHEDPYWMHWWFDYCRSEPLMKDPEFDAVIRGEFRFSVGSKDAADWSHDGKQTW